MIRSKEELIEKIEEARKMLDQSIDDQEKYEEICRKSTMVDGLIEEYIASGY